MKNIVIVILSLIPSLFSGQVKTITDNDILSKIVNNNKPLVIDCYANWCSLCKLMSPILDELATEYKDRVDFYRLDVDENEADNALGINSIPTFYFVKDSEILFEEVGAQSKDDFKISIDYLISVEVKDTAENQEVSESPYTKFTDEKIQELWNE